MAKRKINGKTVLINEQKPPKEYTAQWGKKICDLLIKGRTLTAICKKASFPRIKDVYRWLAENEDFDNMYRNAKRLQADTFYDNIVDIADDKSDDMYEDFQGIKKPNFAAVSRAALRIKTRQQVAAKSAPKKYGDKVQLEGLKESGNAGELLKMLSGWEKIHEKIEESQIESIEEAKEDNPE